MSADRRERLREQARDLLDFQPDEDLPCNRVLGIGLPEEVCENDESLKRWLVCQTVAFAADEDRDVVDAMAEAFELAETQCEFFDLPFPAERRTSFGPLEAQQERQRRLGEVERPERRGTTREGAAPDVDPDQARLGERPARLSEFGAPVDEGGNGGCEGFGTEFSIVPEFHREDSLCGPDGATWVVTGRDREANEVSLTRAGDLEVRGFTDAELGDRVLAGEWRLNSRGGWRLDRFEPQAGSVVWTQPRTGDQLLLRRRRGEWELRVPGRGIDAERYDLGGGALAAFQEMVPTDGEPAAGWETGTSPSGHFVAEGAAPAGVGVIVAVRRGEAVETATGQKIELETIIEVGNEVEVAGTHLSTDAAERQAREIIEDSPGDVAMRLGDSGNGSPRRRR